jgi:hypothetical protein
MTMTMTMISRFIRLHLSLVSCEMLILICLVIGEEGVVESGDIAARKAGRA